MQQLHRSAYAVFACCVILLLAGCTLAIQPPDGTPAPAAPTPGDQDTEMQTQVGMVLQQALQQQLGLDAGEVEIVAVEPVEWPDACLGIATADEVCAQMITPGYRVTLAANGEQYVFHTDAQGLAIRLAEAPAVDGMDALLVWRSPGTEAPCQTAQFALDGIAWGLCGGPLLAAPFAMPERAQELAEYTQRYSNFTAETVAGTVTLTGTGTTAPTPAEERMIAEWGRLVTLEASGGRSGASWGLIFAWHREGGIAGFCDDLTVYVTGIAYATSCRSGAPEDLGRIQLDPTQLETVYGWVDQLQSFEFEQRDPATADAMTTRLIFSGAGSQAATEADQAAILAFAEALFAQGAGEAGGDGTARPTNDYQPLAVEACESLRTALEARLGVAVTRDEQPAPFENLIDGSAGESCRLSTSASAAEFAEVGGFIEVANAVIEQFQSQGWGQDPQYAADSPTSTVTGLRQENALAMVRVDLSPAPGFACAQDEPIATCFEALTPDQELITVTIDLVTPQSP
jgi:hypothetical protein